MLVTFLCVGTSICTPWAVADFVRFSDFRCIYPSISPSVSGLRGDDCGVCPPARDGGKGEEGDPGRPGRQLLVN